MIHGCFTLKKGYLPHSLFHHGNPSTKPTKKMGLISFFCGSLYLICFFFFLFTAATIAYTPTEIIRLDCGATGISSSIDNRIWNPDSGSKYMPSNDNSSIILSAQVQPSSVERIPYLTARIFPSQFTYTFPVSSGPKFLRLYFFSGTYPGLDITKSFFHVSAAGHTLLGSFSVFLSTSSATSLSFSKEFMVFVGDSQSLELTFTPSSPSVDSFAIINGIEIVSMPDNLYLTGVNSPATFVGKNMRFVVDSNTALETLYRLNVGGAAINVNKDTGMFRSWDNDDGFLKVNGGFVGVEPYLGFNVSYSNKTPDYTAPEEVYRTQRGMGPRPSGQSNLMFNMSWIFKVDSGFSYLVRLHFCEFIIDITGNNQLVFTVFLGDQIADKSVDVFRRAGGGQIPIFSDYVVWVPVGNDGIKTKQDLTLSLTPYIGSIPVYTDAILNGIEIMKMNIWDGSPAGPNPPQSLFPTVAGSNSVGCFIYGTLIC